MLQMDTPSSLGDLAWLFRTSRILKFLISGVLVFLTIGIAVGLTTLAQLAGSKNEIAKLRNDLAAAGERISRIERSITQARPAMAPERPAQLLPPHPVAAPLSLNQEDIAVIRAFIKLPPADARTTASISVGDLVPEARLLQMPESITEKLPKLRGTRFTVDRNQAIVIVGSANRVVFVIGPN